MLKFEIYVLANFVYQTDSLPLPVACVVYIQLNKIVYRYKTFVKPGAESGL